ncbi:MAG: cytochrome c-type biogenesis protein [Gemmatimonadota bacterium]
MTAGRDVARIAIAMGWLMAAPWAGAATGTAQTVTDSDADEVGARPAPVALTPAQEARARALEGELRCPVCRSQSIRQSRSFMAEDMKRRIRILVAEGRTDDQIRSFFMERYGAWILLEPPRRGFHLTAWILPAAAVVVGAVGLLLATRRWTRASPPRKSVEPPPESPYLARLERELEETE